MNIEGTHVVKGASGMPVNFALTYAMALLPSELASGGIAAVPPGRVAAAMRAVSMASAVVIAITTHVGSS
jgi:hypothetical protein